MTEIVWVGAFRISSSRNREAWAMCNRLAFILFGNRGNLLEEIE